jgi:glucose-6-phosphate 1-epimerase
MESEQNGLVYSMIKGNNNCPKLQLTSSGGASAEIYLHGAHLTSWKPANGREVIYLSEKSNFGPDATIRGGIPVVFPQFSNRGNLPKHGFARCMDWELIQVSPLNETTSAVFKLVDTPSTRSIWPFAFEALLTISIFSTSLKVTLSVKNSGSLPFSFTSALHTYFKVQDIEDIKIDGLEGCSYLDYTQPQPEKLTQADQPVTFDREVDRIYPLAPHPLYLIEKGQQIKVESAGFPDVVIWNPWEEKCGRLDDMPVQGFRQMVCIEAAAIQSPISLAPQQTWSGHQLLSMEKR